MNSNRTKYASTPTYGMQKRNFAKKQAAAQATPTPDFTQQPMMDTNGATPFAAPNPFGIPQGAIPGVSQAAGASFFSAQPQMGQPMAQPQPMYGMPQQPYGAGQPFGGAGAPMNSFAAPNGMNAMPVGNGMGGYMAPSQAPGMPMYQQNYQQPMPSMGGMGFGAGVQGYVQQPYAQGSAVPPSVTRSEPVPGFGGASGMMGNAQPMQGMGNGYPNPGFGGMPTAGANPAFATAPYPPVMNMNGGNGFARPPFGGDGGTPAMPTPRPPFDVDKWFKVILFLVLPLLFIPCVFVTHAFDFLRYLFIIASVVSLSVLWYRQSFTPAMRTAVTVGYLVLCIIVIAMLISNNRDATQANNLAGRNNVQTSAEPTASPEAMAPAAQPTPPPVEDVGESEAEQRLATFMDYWQLNRIEDMVNLVQPSWATVQDNAASALFTVISNRTPQDYAIEGISGTSADSSRTVTMSAFIDKNNGKEPVRYRFMILMVKESGQWFVDPNSLATNDIATESPSPAPGKETVVQSLQPRMTVTPIPDADTKLYYNANGGKYYHADPNCAAVNPKFLPMASFLYKELDDDPYKSLQPCLKCGAPTQSLGKLAEQATETPTVAP